jgi:hypothetical protein
LSKFRSSILTIPADLLLPEDAAHGEPGRDHYDGGDLDSATEKFSSLCQKVQNAKLERAMLRRKLQALEVGMAIWDERNWSFIMSWSLFRKFASIKSPLFDAHGDLPKRPSLPRRWRGSRRRSRPRQPASRRWSRRSRTTSTCAREGRRRRTRSSGMEEKIRVGRRKKLKLYFVERTNIYFYYARLQQGYIMCSFSVRWCEVLLSWTNIAAAANLAVVSCSSTSCAHSTLPHCSV